MDSPARTSRSFRVLDASLSIDGPEPVVRPIVAAFGRFAIPGPPVVRSAHAHPDTHAPGSSHEHGDEHGRAPGTHAPGPSHAHGHAPGTTVFVNGSPVSAIEGINPTLLAYHEFCAEIERRTGSLAFVHAASVVDPQGEALLIAAPTGYGKTSLTIELLRRGYRFLGDHYAPIDLSTGRVHPYPRALTVLASGTAPIPDPFRLAASDPAAPRLLGRAVVDPGRVLGDDVIAGSPAPLRHVVLLTGGDPAETSPASSLLSVVAHLDGRERLSHRFDAIDGVTVADRAEAGVLCEWLLELDHERLPTSELTHTLDDGAVLFVERADARAPDFGAAPAMHPMLRREAAVLLGREMVNRRGGSLLLERYEGMITALFLDLAGALSEAQCWQLRPGALTTTADLVESLSALRR